MTDDTDRIARLEREAAMAWDIANNADNRAYRWKFLAIQTWVGLGTTGCLSLFLWWTR